ncbi:MAG: hypothetical protein ACO4CU_02585 [Ilumatobacteraceae bacterium]
MESPGGFDRAAEWPGDDGRSVRSAERIEQPFAAVGERELGAVVTALPGGVTDRRRPSPPAARANSGQPAPRPQAA